MNEDQPITKPAPRSLEVIQHDYSELCRKFGDKFIRIRTFEADLQKLLAQIEVLAAEAVESEKVQP